MLRYTKRTNTSEMKAFYCAVLILCLTTGYAMPQIAGPLCNSTSLHDTLCAPLRIAIVLRAKVVPLQLRLSTKNGIYRLEVSQIFSAPNQGVCSIPWPYILLQTPSPTIGTRLTLELGVEYLLTGDINQTSKVMRMNKCNWHKKWKDMSTDDKRELLDKSCNKDSDNENFP